MSIKRGGRAQVLLHLVLAVTKNREALRALALAPSTRVEVHVPGAFRYAPAKHGDWCFAFIARGGVVGITKGRRALLPRQDAWARLVETADALWVVPPQHRLDHRQGWAGSDPPKRLGERLYDFKVGRIVAQGLPGTHAHTALMNAARRMLRDLTDLVVDPPKAWPLEDQATRWVLTELSTRAQNMLSLLSSVTERTHNWAYTVAANRRLPSRESALFADEQAHRLAQARLTLRADVVRTERVLRAVRACTDPAQLQREGPLVGMLVVSVPSL